MGLFFKKKGTENSLVIYSRFNGKAAPIEFLKDKTFAEKVISDGIAIIPKEGKIYAPINGIISTLLDSKHACGVTFNEGCDQLVHVGQDTINLKGNGFTARFKREDKVNNGGINVGDVLLIL